MNRSKARIETVPKGVIAYRSIRIPVMACGPGWLVVDKPSGISIHNDPGTDLCSLVLAAVRAGQVSDVDQAIAAIHAVHRLDRDTSGIVLLAADAKTLADFGGQFSSRTVQKRYLAMIHGRIGDDADTPDWSVWDWSLTASATGRKDPQGKGQRVACTTRWRSLAHSRHYSLIECEPLTGRKHQIRRHAKLSGHPLVGDRRYGSARSRAFLRQHCNFNRLGLHAHSLTLGLPGETTATTFRSAGLPETMRRLLESDR